MLSQLKRHHDEGGFTLIELLIVIIVLGILAAIVVFAVGSTRKDSVTSACKTDAKSIQLSLEAQNTKNGAYPNAADSKDSTKGALLKTWPTSTDYTFAYQSPTGTSPATGGSTYTVVIAGSKVTGGSWTDANDSTIAAACAGT